MSNRATNIVAILLLLFMAGLAFFSMIGDSATFDESSHIPAGYSYISQKDVRINPEHPPLVKDLAGILPYIFLDINFPKDHQSWAKNTNDQWWFGSTFLYDSGNDSEKIIILARIPMILIMLLLGFYVFKWAREIGGNKTGLLALTFYSFSPTFLAHGRYVTTDVAASMGFFVSLYYFWKFLKDSSKKNLIFASIAYGIAQLLKFTVFLITPAMIILAIIWAFVHKKSILKYFLYSLLIIIFGFVLIYAVYIFHVWNLPAERQLNDSKIDLATSPMKNLANIDFWMASVPILRPAAQYFLGFLLVFQRGIFGNTTYFMGEISANGWWYYFPIVYLIKTQIAFHIFTIASLIFGILSLKKLFCRQFFQKIKLWLSENFVVFSMLSFVFAYWFVSLSGKLTLGIRHLSPLFPFMFVLVSFGIIKIFEKLRGKSLTLGKIIFTGLMLWYIIPIILLFPSFLTYFNELVGGPSGGSKYVTDSNLDWGQDLKRLKKWVDDNNIKKIKIDYFGGGSPAYYFGDNYEGFDPKKGQQKGWLAISANSLMGGMAKPAPGFNEKTDYYNWIKEYTPVTVIGNSIFVYYIN